MESEILKKINKYKDKDVWIIFFKRGCGYCNRTFNLLRQQKKSYKGYDVNNIDGSLQKVIQRLESDPSINFDSNHQTVPIILYKGKFIGGYDKLKLILTQE
jgi:glutaredoxin